MRRAGIAGVLEAILVERHHQDKKYGPVLDYAGYLGSGDKTEIAPLEQGPGGHEIPGWLLVIEKELNEAKAAATGEGKRSARGRHSSRAEILQIAAVCVAALEQHGLPEDA